MNVVDTMMTGLFLTFTCSLLLVCSVLSLAAPEYYPASTANTDDPTVLQLVAEARRLGPVANDRSDDEKHIFLNPVFFNKSDLKGD